MFQKIQRKNVLLFTFRYLFKFFLCSSSPLRGEIGTWNESKKHKVHKFMEAVSFDKFRITDMIFFTELHRLSQLNVYKNNKAMICESQILQPNSWRLLLVNYAQSSSCAFDLISPSPASDCKIEIIKIRKDY